jgi:S1-C subfamily serine protease
MDTGKPRSTIGVLVVPLLLLVVLGSVVLYYNSALSNMSSSNSSQVNSLQDQLTALQSAYLRLASQTTTQASNHSALSGPAQIYSADSNSVVTVQGTVVTTVQTIFGPRQEVSTVLGSGFVTLFQGSTYVITNFHVVDGVTNMTVTFSDGDSYRASAVGTDPYSDLAVVSVQAPSSEFSPIAIDPSSGVVVGDPVYVIGNPYGLSGSMTFGIVSQLGRTIQESTAGRFSISGVIQFSAPINPGNSGGPLLDEAGNVIGITTAVVSGSQGVGFAIPSTTILRELPSLIATGGYSQHSYMGIGSVDMSYQLAADTGSNVTYGVLVERVTAGGPASQAGLRGGDRNVTVDGYSYMVGGDQIVSVNGTKIVSLDALSTYLEEHTVAGQSIQLGVVRDGSAITLSLKLGARPPPPG